MTPKFLQSAARAEADARYQSALLLVNGKPCGNSHIPSGATCRVGEGLVSPPVDYDHDATTKDAIAYFGERGPKRDFSPEHKAASEAAQTALRAVLSAKSNPSAAPAAKSAVQAAVRLLDENGRRGETRLVIDLAKDSGVFQKPYDFSTHRLPEHIRTFYRTVPPSKQTASEMMASMPGVQRLNR